MKGARLGGATSNDINHKGYKYLRIRYRDTPGFQFVEFHHTHTHKHGKVLRWIDCRPEVLCSCKEPDRLVCLLRMIGGEFATNRYDPSF